MVDSPFGLVVDSVSVAKAVRGVRRLQSRISRICIFSIHSLFHRVGSVLTILKKASEEFAKTFEIFGTKFVWEENFMFAVALKRLNLSC